MLNKKMSFFVLPLVATLSLHANDPMNDPFFQDPFGDDIFKEMMQMQQNMDKMFERMHHRMQQRTSRQLTPLGTYQIQQPSQFIDKGDHYVFKTTIPESKENQIDIHSGNGQMSITAKIIQKQERQTASGYSSSSSMRMYQQSMSLPLDADESTIDMGYEQGKLVISVKKKKTSQTNNATPIKHKLDKENNSTKSKEINTSKPSIHTSDNNEVG